MGKQLQTQIIHFKLICVACLAFSVPFRFALLFAELLNTNGVKLFFFCCCCNPIKRCKRTSTSIQNCGQIIVIIVVCDSGNLVVHICHMDYWARVHWFAIWNGINIWKFKIRAEISALFSRGRNIEMCFFIFYLFQTIERKTHSKCSSDRCIDFSAYATHKHTCTCCEKRAQCLTWPNQKIKW